jgi:hypothetical protein
MTIRRCGSAMKYPHSEVPDMTSHPVSQVLNLLLVFLALPKMCDLAF